MEEIGSICAQVHRKIKLGDMCAICLKKCDSLHQLNGPHSNNSKKSNDNNEQFPCSHCKRPVVASRFAPHLEKCMGMGRASSRLKARQGTVSKETWVELSEEDSDHDSEFNGEPKR